MLFNIVDHSWLKFVRGVVVEYCRPLMVEVCQRSGCLILSAMNGSCLSVEWFVLFILSTTNVCLQVSQRSGYSWLTLSAINVSVLLKELFMLFNIVDHSWLKFVRGVVRVVLYCRPLMFEICQRSGSCCLILSAIDV